MDRLTQKLATANAALDTLREALERDLADTVIRDGAIQRFEYTFEALRKAARVWLLHVEGLETGGPKSTIRGCHAAGVLEDEVAERALQMAGDRNLTSHTYKEDVALEVVSRLPAHCELMAAWLERMRTP